MTDKDALGAALDSACDGLVTEVAGMIAANHSQRFALQYAEAEMRNRLASIDFRALPIPEAPASVEPVGGEDIDEKMVNTAVRNLKSFIGCAGFKSENDRSASIACVEVIEDRLRGLDDLVLVLRSAFAASKSAPPAFGGGDLREGPAPIPNTRMQCFGCKHLETKDWREPSGDGETFDSGTSARCKAVPTEHGGQSIGVYWSRTNDAPKWCPFLAALPPVKQSVGHLSDCAVHNEPAMPNGPCDCGLGQQRGGSGE